MSVALLGVGLIGAVRPDVLYRLQSKDEDEGETPTRSQLRSLRTSSVIVPLLAGLGLFVILTTAGG